MKRKVLSLALALMLLMSLAACGSTPAAEPAAPEAPAAEAPAETPAETPAEAPAEEPAAEPVDDTVYTLVATTHVPGGGTAGKVFQAVLAEITSRSNGRIVFDVYTDGTLSDAAGAIDALESGMADVAMVNYSRLNGRLDLTGVCSLPGMFSNSWEGMKAMTDLMDNNPAFQAMLAACGVRAMGIQLGTQTIVMSKSEITDLTDLAGKSVISGSSAIDGILLGVGANPVSFANSEAYEAVSKGTADALASNSLSGNLGFGIEEVCKYMYNIPLGTGPMLYCISQSAYDGLPTDLQAVVDDVYHDFTADIIYKDYVLELDSDTSYEDTFTAAGGTITEPTAEQLEDFQTNTCVPAWDAWVSSMADKGFADAQSVLDQFRELLATYEGTCPDFQ